MFNHRFGAGTGYLQVFGDKPYELDSFTCSHCNAVHFQKPLARPEDTHGYCDKCEKLICPTCLNKAKRNGEKCEPWEEKLKRAEARYRFLRDAGLWDDYPDRDKKDPLGIVV